MIMKHSKKLVIIAIFMFSVCKSSAQVEFGMSSLYDPTTAGMLLEAQRSYLNTMREMAALRRQLMPIVLQTYDIAHNEYNRGNYSECIRVISTFFNSYTIYNGLGNICKDLYELKGMAHIKLEDYSTGVQLLRIAMDQGSNSAYNELSEIFQTNFQEAQHCYEKGDYTLGYKYITKAHATGFENSAIYILQGDICAKQHDFDGAKNCYEIAKKKGNSWASERLKQLKIAKKEYYKR